MTNHRSKVRGKGSRQRSAAARRHAEDAARERKAAQEYQKGQKKFNEEVEELENGNCE